MIRSRAVDQVIRSGEAARFARSTRVCLLEGRDQVIRSRADHFARSLTPIARRGENPRVSERLRVSGSSPSFQPPSSASQRKHLRTNRRES